MLRWGLIVVTLLLVADSGAVAATKHHDKRATSGSKYAQACATAWPRYLVAVRNEYDDIFDEGEDPFDVEGEHRKYLAYCLMHGVDSVIQKELQDWGH
jgi:hypothetical protein